MSEHLPDVELSPEHEALAADLEHKLRFGWAQKKAARLIVYLEQARDCPVVFDRAQRIGACMACGKYFTCGAALRAAQPPAADPADVIMGRGDGG